MMLSLTALPYSLITSSIPKFGLFAMFSPASKNLLKLSCVLLYPIFNRFSPNRIGRALLPIVIAAFAIQSTTLLFNIFLPSSTAFPIISCPNCLIRFNTPGNLTIS